MKVKGISDVFSNLKCCRRGTSGDLLNISPQPDGRDNCNMEAVNHQTSDFMMDEENKLEKINQYFLYQRFADSCTWGRGEVRRILGVIGTDFVWDIVQKWFSMFARLLLTPEYMCCFHLWGIRPPCAQV